jgi:hypothetical protein
MKYKELKPGELIKKGDEYWIKNDNDWCPTQLIDQEVPRVNFLKYRRPIKNNHPNTNVFK